MRATTKGMGVACVDVTEAIFLFKDGSYLKLTAEQWEQLTAYEDFDYITVNGITFKRCHDEND